MNMPLEIDLFAKKPQLRLPNGSKRYTTLIGCVCTLLYIAAVAAFGFFTLRDIIDMKNVTVSQSVQRSFWEPYELFPPINNLDQEAIEKNKLKDIQIAFGIVQPGFPLEKLDENIGTIKAYYKEWDYTKDDGFAEPYLKELKDEQCELAELGLQLLDKKKEATEQGKADLTAEEAPAEEAPAEEAPVEDVPVEEAPPVEGGRRLAMWDEQPYRFWPEMDQSSEQSLKKYHSQFRCIKQDSKTKENEHISLSGSSTQLKGKQLVILFEKCDSNKENSNCVAPSVVQQQLLKGKSIVLFVNERTFDENNFDNPFFERSKVIWVPFGTEMIEDNYFSLEIGSLQSTDNRFQPFAEYDEDEWSMGLWQFQRGRTVGYRDLKQKPNALASVTIELDLDLYKTMRTQNDSYAIWFAMLGGVIVGLYILFFVLEYFLTNKAFENYMASELYFIPENVDDALGKKEQPTGCCGSSKTDGLTRKRYTIPRDFHNEIICEEGKILNTSRVASWCKIFRPCFCCCRRRRIERIFQKARVFNAQELNITSIVKAQRESQAAIKILQKQFGYYEAEPIINQKVKKAIRLSDDEGEQKSAVDIAYELPQAQQFEASQQAQSKMDIENQNDKTVMNSENPHEALIQNTSVKSDGKKKLESADFEMKPSGEQDNADAQKKQRRKSRKRDVEGRSPEGDAANAGSDGGVADEEDKRKSKNRKSKSRRDRDADAVTPDGENDGDDGARVKNRHREDGSRERKDRHREDGSRERKRRHRDRDGENEEEDVDRTKRKRGRSRRDQEDGEENEESGERRDKRRHKSKSRRNDEDRGDGSDGGDGKRKSKRR